MSNFCTDPMYTCGETEDAVTSFTAETDFTHNGTRTFTLTSGSATIIINKRDRKYHYHDKLDVVRSNFKFLETGQSKIECYTQNQATVATIKEKYTTTDVTFYYADLRNDLFVYKKSEQELQFEDGRDFQVELRTSYGGTYVYPFILEDVPITITDTYFCTGILGELHRETRTSGYFDGIRILMPGFTERTSPTGENFTINGVLYTNDQVNWYYLPSHEESDGDRFFYWPDWLKAVGTNFAVDKDDRDNVWSINGGSYSPDPRNMPDGVATLDFTGGVAIDRSDNIFFSATFEGGMLKINKLNIDGAETPIPTEKTKVLQLDGTYQEEDSRHDAYYPVAPL